MATAQAVTLTEINHTSVKKITFDWLCTDLGVVSQVTANAYDGKILALVTDPDAGGDAPSDNYNITLLDSGGVDVLIEGGLLRDTANTEVVASASLGAVAGSKLTLAIADAGDANKGLVHVYIR